MKPLFLLALVALATTLFVGCAHRSTVPKPSDTAGSLPPPSAEATELQFTEFFVSPVGPRGLALTDKLTDLNGKRVRMVGYMVEQHGGLPGRFLLAPLPLQLHDHDSALADDLPAAAVHVTVPTCLGREIPYVPGPMLLTGTLSVGHHEEADGRMSLVRMELDPPKDFIDPRRRH